MFGRQLPIGDFQMPQMDTSVGQPLQMPAQQPKKGGMFGSGGGWVDAVQAALAGYLASRGNPVGMYGLQALQQKRQQALEAQQHQQGREEDFQDFVRKQGWMAANKPPEVPDIVERINALNGIRQGLGDTYAQNYANNGGSPFGSLFTDPATGQKYMMGGGQQSLPAIGSVIDDPRKQGGPMPSASGGFPPSGY